MPTTRTGFGCLASLEEIKGELQIIDTENDEELVEVADSIASMFDAQAERPLIYRGTLEDDDKIVDAKSWIDGSLALEPAAASLGAPRSISVAWSVQTPTGSVLVSGSLAGVAVTEAFVASDQPLRGTKLFDAVTGAVVTGQASAAGTVDIGTVVPHIEYHSLRDGLPTSDLYLVNRPVQIIAALYEDASRGFAADTKLASNSDYVLHNSSGKLTKVKGMGLTVDFPEDYFMRFPQKLPNWNTAPRAIKAIYTGGIKLDERRTYVPGDLKDGYLQTLAIRWRERGRRMQGTSSVSDNAGGTSRFSKGEIPEHVAKVIMRYRTLSMTGELEEA